MIKATPQQRAQIDEFFMIMRNHIEDTLLYPCKDEKTGVVRMAICIADRKNDIIYVKGLWFLPNDPIYGRFKLEEPETEVLTEKPAGFVRRFISKTTNWWRTRKL